MFTNGRSWQFGIVIHPSKKIYVAPEQSFDVMSASDEEYNAMILLQRFWVRQHCCDLAGDRCSFCCSLYDRAGSTVTLDFVSQYWVITAEFDVTDDAGHQVRNTQCYNHSSPKPSTQARACS